MPQLRTDKLVEQAQAGQKLTAADRRRAVAFMMANHPEYSNVDLGELFLVTERTIREDKASIRDEVSKCVREDDISRVIGDIILNFERQIRDIERGKRCEKICTPGSRTYLEYCKAIFDLEIKKMNALQDLGYYPKNLGTMTQEKFVFTAEVGIMTTEGGGVQQKIAARDAEDNAVIDAEFTDVAPKRIATSTPEETPKQSQP